MRYYRARRAGQDLASAEVWRSLALLGVSDAFIVPVEAGWQPFVELTEGRQRWALAKAGFDGRSRVGYPAFPGDIGRCLCHAGQSRLSAGEKEAEAMPMRVPEPPAPPAEDGNRRGRPLAHARSARQASGWELIYSRQRASR